MKLPGNLAGPLTGVEQIGLAAAGAALVAVVVYGVRAWRQSRVTPEERERLRRSWLVATGKMGDANLVEVRENHVFYAYLVRGVEYVASQDVAHLASFLPPDLSQVGAVAVRYDSRNPANSIIVAEQWSGMRLGESYRK
jgi:hypothetical protein